MNPTTNAIRSGFARGWTEFKLSLQSPQDQGFYVFMSVLVLAYLWFNRNTEIEGTNLSYPTVVLPSMLGGSAGLQPDNRSRLCPGHGARGRDPAPGQRPCPMVSSAT